MLHDICLVSFACSARDRGLTAPEDPNETNKPLGGCLVNSLLFAPSLSLSLSAPNLSISNDTFTQFSVCVSVCTLDLSMSRGVYLFMLT